MPPVRFGVVVFPGSNCDHDAYHAVKKVLDQEAEFLWHKDGALPELDAVILPGGFSYGDYLRCGAIARFSPLMREVVRFAESGGYVLGICNGFQILCEAGLLPGALLRNSSLRFVCKRVYLRAENSDTAFTRALPAGKVLSIPVAHGEGNYYTDEDTLAALKARGQVLFRYCSDEGTLSDSANPNGSIDNIAGVMNQSGNVLGMMPHPERSVEAILGSEDGKAIFQSMIKTITGVSSNAASKE